MSQILCIHNEIMDEAQEKMPDPCRDLEPSV